MNKIITTIITVTALLIGFLGFAVPAQAAAPSWTNKDRAFVRAVRAEAPAFRVVPARNLIGLAKSICEYLDYGGTVLEAAEMGVESGFTMNQSAAVTAGAVVFYCPRHEGQFGEY